MSQINIDLLILDFDGVLTDNRIYATQSGEETVTYHRGDGRGIRLLKNVGLEIIILSTETNPVVSAHAKSWAWHAYKTALTKRERSTRSLPNGSGF